MADVHGTVAPGFEAVAAAFAANLDSGDDLGASFAAIRDGEILVDIFGGFADRTKSTAWSRETLAPVFSTTKGVAALVVAWCVDQGLFTYEDRVATLWPDFAAHGKDRLTVAEALSHQAGVPGFPQPIDPTLWLDTDACAEAIAALAPMWPPGSASGYHPMTWGYIAGAIVARTAGRTLGHILREEICAPAGIDFFIGTPEREHARCAEMQKPRQLADFGAITPARKAAFFEPWSAPARGGTTWRAIELPAANGHGAALSVAQLYAVYATGGEAGGRRILSPRTYDALIARRTEGDDLVLPFRIDWRTGIMGNNNHFYGPNPAALGHSGSGGSCGFGDAALRLSAGYVMNKQSHHLMGDPRALRLIDALYSCLKP